MSIEIVYYNTLGNLAMQEALTALGAVNPSFGEDRRSFLVALSKAVSVSKTIVAVGDIAQLTKVLSKGLGMPLANIDWASLGIMGMEESQLPEGALPLLLGGKIGGMIIENADQCIIAVNNDQADIGDLTNTYVLPYLQAFIKDAEPATEEVAVAEPIVEDVVTEEPVAEVVEETAEPVEEIQQELVFDQNETEESLDDQWPEEYVEEESDLFSDIENDDFLDLSVKTKKKGFVIALVCILVVLVIGIVGGYFGYTKWWLPNMYEVSLDNATKLYTKATATDVADANMPEEYSAKFAALYKQNSDIISWLKVDGMGINTPVVTGARHSAKYYETHLFDGQSNPYGTPYIKYSYDTGANINPNLVVYGNNTGDGKAFSKLESLIDGDGKIKSITTESVLFGEEKWKVISVMLIAKSGNEYDYTDNFKELDAAARTDMIKNAVKKSKVKTDVTGEDIDSVELTDNFLTLVTPYSKNSSKVVVVVAERIVE